MARTMKKHLVVNGDMSGALTSEVIDLDHINLAAIYCKFTGAPTGVLKIEFSENGLDFYIPTGATQVVAAAGTWTTWYRDVASAYMRISYEFSGGVGSLNVHCTLKGY